MEFKRQNWSGFERGFVRPNTFQNNREKQLQTQVKQNKFLFVFVSSKPTSTSVQKFLLNLCAFFCNKEKTLTVQVLTNVFFRIVLTIYLVSTFFLCIFRQNKKTQKEKEKLEYTEQNQIPLFTLLKFLSRKEGQTKRKKLFLCTEAVVEGASYLIFYHSFRKKKRPVTQWQIHRRFTVDLKSNLKKS